MCNALRSTRRCPEGVEEGSFVCGVRRAVALDCVVESHRFRESCVAKLTLIQNVVLAELVNSRVSETCGRKVLQ